ncbi:hypothetical protein FA15DRAFT_123971 [Coprinopsis marcescibilis]|uniref:Uncharacterized protein n=1 Tax=Coprinopsis marcescibilis TaxID=230819 RepID=A0A5C3KKT8_COPMA|nr:hypothetical protein FA15DRAFT_123971 [Coprinopsis marcescibilis]
MLSVLTMVTLVPYRPLSMARPWAPSPFDCIDLDVVAHALSATVLAVRMFHERFRDVHPVTTERETDSYDAPYDGSWCKIYVRCLCFRS